jgi:hypothetical protein
MKPRVRTTTACRSLRFPTISAGWRATRHRPWTWQSTPTEHPRSIAAGIPVVSVSLGDTARFLLGGLRRKDAVEACLLESGDVFVFGGPARLRYHGVSRTLPGSAPPELAVEGRFNITLRQYDVGTA